MDKLGRKRKRSLGNVQPEREPERIPLPSLLRDAETEFEQLTQVVRSPIKGLTVRSILEGHRGRVSGVAWSRDGRFLASASDDGTVRIWSAETGDLFSALSGSYRIRSVDWSLDGRMLAWAAGDYGRVALWDVQNSKLLGQTEDFDEEICATALAWSPKEQLIAVGFNDCRIRVWDVGTAQYVKVLEGHKQVINCLAWLRDGETLASCSSDRTIRLWSPRLTKALSVLEGHSDDVYSVNWVPDGTILASSSKDQTIRLWEPLRQHQLNILEGHTGSVTSVSFSADGRLLASQSTDGTVRLWRTGTWQEAAAIPISRSTQLGTVGFHPIEPILATLGEANSLLEIWNVNTDIFADGESVTPGIQYTTAKLVLVGDSGVGKTGLGWRLARGEFKEHASTHGQQFWVINELGTKRQDGTECEAVLWDLAGQHNYRPIHAIFLDDVDLSLVLFDPSNRQEPLRGAQFWLEQLAGKNKLPAAVLVGARVDVSPPALSQVELDQFCERYGISGGYVGTSAKRGDGLDQLMNILRTQIPWERMTATVTTITFKQIKEYVLLLKQQPKRQGVLVRPEELRKQMQKSEPEWQFTDAQMMTAAKHLETHGYVAILRSSSGEEAILLFPELLAGLASSIVLQADTHPRELGSLSETALLQGGYPFPELVKLENVEQQILLDVAVMRFLSHNICFRENLGAEALLIFPGLIKQKRPLLDEVETADDVSYIVRGRTENVYPALVVLLGYTQTFTRINQWKNQAQYELGQGEICGFRMIEEREGQLELVLYYSPTMPVYGRRLFQGLFEQFLYQRDVEVTRFPPVVCPDSHRQERATIVKRLREGKGFLFCAECGKETTLPEIDKPLALGAKDARRVQRAELLARMRSAYEAHLVRVKGFRRDRVAPRCYISHMPEQLSWVSELAQDLRDAGALVLLDRAEILEQDFVILVGTPAYKQAWIHSDEPIARDINLIRARTHHGATRWPTIVPLMLTGDLDTAHIAELRDRIAGDFRDETHYSVSLFDLVLTLYAIPFNHPAFELLRKSLQEQWEETFGKKEEIQELRPLKVFISYAHRDEEFKEEFVTMLAGLQRRGLIDAWEDRRIEEGSEWYLSIRDSINECDLALLLVSKHFLASRFIQSKELPALLQHRKGQGVRVVPIIVRPCLWQSEPVLSDLQALPKNGKPVISFPEHTGQRDQVWTEIARAVETRAKEHIKQLKS